MSLRNLLILNSFVLGISGLCAILFPPAVLSLYGVESNPSALLMAQYAGLGSLAIGLIAWFCKDLNEKQARRTIVPAFLITYIAGVIISVLGTISEMMRIGWAVIGIYLVFAIAYGFYQFKKIE